MLEDQRDQRDQRIAKLEKQVQVMKEIILNIAPMAWEADNPCPEGRGIALIDDLRNDWRRERDAFIDKITLQLNS